VFSQQAADTTQWADNIDWMVRCDWLQNASSSTILYTHNANEGCKTCASLAGFVASFIAVVMASSCKFQLLSYRPICDKGSDVVH